MVRGIFWNQIPGCHFLLFEDAQQPDYSNEVLHVLLFLTVTERICIMYLVDINKFVKSQLVQQIIAGETSQPLHMNLKRQ